ncbi:MAG TPA: hypothetical protein VFF35_12590 [Bacteroidia bacterium]|nr:hypothetical protein [Bacteroidia bacterium]
MGKAYQLTLHIRQWRAWCSIAKPGISINFAAHGFWFGAVIATSVYAENVGRKFMRKCIIYTLIALILGCSDTTREDEKLKNFNEFLGKDKAEALDAAVESFQNFLKINYPDKRTLGERTELFLKTISEEPYFDQTWNFNSKKDAEIIAEFEKTSLRKDIYLYGFENYDHYFNLNEVYNPKLFENKNSDSIDLGSLDLSPFLEEEEIIELNIEDSIREKRDREFKSRMQNSLFFNNSGLFLYALAKFGAKDTVVTNYLDVKIVAGDILTPMLANGLIQMRDNKKLEEPFIQRIIVAEIYFPIVRAKLKE